LVGSGSSASSSCVPVAVAPSPCYLLYMCSLRFHHHICQGPGKACVLVFSRTDLQNSQASLMERCAYPTNNSQPLALHLISPAEQTRSSYYLPNPTNRQEATRSPLVHTPSGRPAKVRSALWRWDGVRLVPRPPVLFGSNMPGRLDAYWAS